MALRPDIRNCQVRFLYRSSLEVAVSWRPTRLGVVLDRPKRYKTDTRAGRVLALGKNGRHIFGVPRAGVDTCCKVCGEE